MLLLSEVVFFIHIVNEWETLSPYSDWQSIGLVMHFRPVVAMNSPEANIEMILAYKSILGAKNGQER